MNMMQKEKSGYLPRYFSKEETRELSPDLVPLLDLIRSECGWPFVINSGYRVEDPLSHGKGEAVDIKLWDWDSPFWDQHHLPRMSKGQQRQKIHDAARKHGINRIGCYNFHLHIDISKTLPQDVTWIGLSR